MVILQPKKESSITFLFARECYFFLQVVRFNKRVLHIENGIASKSSNESPESASSLTHSLLLCGIT